MSESEAKDYAKEGLARFKIPKYMKFVEEYPMTVTGKIQKFKLRDRAIDDFPHLKDEQ